MALGDRVRAAGQGLFAYFARHPTASNLLMLLMLLSGVAAGSQIRSQFFPDVVADELRVTVRWDGAGSEDVDAGIVALLEPALLAVEGVESSEAVANEGRARIILGFEPGWEMGRAVSDVEAAADAVTGLPETAERPEVRREEWRDRVTDVIIHGPVPVASLGRYADEFVARLYREGITRATIRGVADPVIRVEVPEAQLIRHDITLREVADVIAAGADAAPAGDVAGSGTRLRAGSERREADAIGDLAIRSDAEGAELRIRDVARVAAEGADAGRAYFVNGAPAISIRVDRSDRGDAIAMQRKTREVAAALQRSLPEGVKIELVRTRAEGITDRLDLLLRNGMIGLALVVGLLFLFLNARTAFWVAAGIPVAMSAAVGLMFAAGLTLNMMSIFGLILCLGLVVDDAIVVAEHADWRRRHRAEAPAVAAETAARRMALPVFSATITTILAFFGLAFIGGRFGTLIADIPFTVIAVLSASLVECFLVLPHHMAGALAARPRSWADAPSRLVNRGLEAFRIGAFEPAVRWIIRLRYPVIAAALLLLAQSAAMFIRGDVTWRFFSPPEQGSVTANVAMLPGAGRADTEAMVRELERAVAAVDARFAAEYGRAPVASAIAVVGATSGRGLAGEETKDPDQLGAIDVDLIDPDLRPYSGQVFVQALEAEVVRLPRLETLSFRSWGQGPGGDALDVKFFGPDVRVLKAAAEALKAELAPLAIVSGLEDSLAYDKTELVLDLTPLGKRLGFSIEAVGAELFARLEGIEAAEFAAGTRTATVRVGLPEDETAADFLSRTRLRTADGAHVPLSEIVSVESRPGFSALGRENGRRVVSVTGDVSEDEPAAAAELTRELETAILPGIAERFGVDYEFGGLAAQERDFLGEALVGFLLCLAGIYLTLAWVFESWVRPVVVMAVIPFGLIGTIWGHWQWGLAMSLFTVVGLIGMTGIIINNAIVLIATIDGHGSRRALVPAVVAAAGDRLRPILLTSLTTVLGLGPLMYERSSQALFLKPTVVTLVYGLGIGAVLVLILVPALVVVQRDIARLLTAWRRGLGLRRRGPAPGLSAIVAVASLAGFAWLGVTLGPWLLEGALAGPAARLAPFLPGWPPGWVALAALAAGMVVLLAAGALAGAILLRRSGAAHGVRAG
ncbi:efflux RND transporter permease subunit [Amaricoccus sp.]|uniref:efflux RND transporter permease subunit n=1 Tax=Amaricoccus sp. TaxID=1872485 RepID=UPI002C45E6D2|nr:efflux RND transporter permease subunit [Amaricoccus sp.]HRW15788.1 efflux RND transporter permease subunit [Amaricoccus sp.]